MSRRAFVAGAAACLQAAAAGHAHAADGLSYGPAEPFGFDGLVARAAELAKVPYRPPAVPGLELIRRIDYDAYQKIRYRPDRALWADIAGCYPVELFHVGRFFPEPVHIHVAEGGQAREVRYAPALFTFVGIDFAEALPPDLGFAGFRVLGAPGAPDWLAFLGASYFRAAGETGQYGLSARGLAIDVAMPSPEEFPRFTNFWLERRSGGPGLTIYALLEGPSVTGAYRIAAAKERGIVTAVEATVFARRSVARLGLAPLTSMFWYSKVNREQAVDWRPEIHDSDGLALWTGTGERIWRPLNNPKRVQTSSFFDTGPRGFGLMQRERRFDQFEDDGVFYDRRPNVWVEPLENWGEGAVQLVEIPTGDEIHDNIVAYWTPKAPFEQGQKLTLRYRLHWLNSEPVSGPVARVVATRRGAGGVPGQPRPQGVFKYVIDFDGGPLGSLADRDDAVPAVTAAKGRISRAVAYRVVGTSRYRALFDFAPEGSDPVDLRCYLSKNGTALTETWLYQHLA